jgi:hypothetical protein
MTFKLDDDDELLLMYRQFILVNDYLNDYNDPDE